MAVFNKKSFLELLQDAKKYIKGEPELTLINDDWYIMDYREELGGSFPVEKFNMPIISTSMAKICNIDVIACCDECAIYHVG